MAPKKKNAKPPRDDPASEPASTIKSDAAKDTDVKEPANDDNINSNGTSEASKKRKHDSNADKSQKAPRRSGRGGMKSQPSQQQLIKFMLSDKAEMLLRSEDEAEDMKKRGQIRSYASSVLNPYEELLCAVILSRPISHRLGLRTIRTVLNDPYNFTSAKATRDAGSEKQHQALWDAKTQHKDKTAQQIGQIAEVVLEKFTTSNDKEGTQLQKVRDDCDEDVDHEHDMLKESIKGLGKTGLEIFFRRVQWLWDEAFPYIDSRTADGLRKLGLPQDGEQLERLIGEHWKTLDGKRLAGKGEGEKKRRAFVVVLERATGADLEGMTDALFNAAMP